MSRTSRNFVIAYVVLVGLPLLALAAVLRSGRSLKAPISVDGSWKVTAMSSDSGNQPCAETLASVSKVPLHISQSGASLFVSVGDAAASVDGKLEGTGVKANLSVPPKLSVSACSASSILLSATVDPKSEPRSLTGTLSMPGCASCEALPIRAVRQPRAQIAGGLH